MQPGYYNVYASQAAPPGPLPFCEYSSTRHCTPQHSQSFVSFVNQMQSPPPAHPYLQFPAMMQGFPGSSVPHGIPPPPQVSQYNRASHAPAMFHYRSPPPSTDQLYYPPAFPAQGYYRQQMPTRDSISVPPSHGPTKGDRKMLTLVNPMTTDVLHTTTGAAYNQTVPSQMTLRGVASPVVGSKLSHQNSDSVVYGISSSLTFPESRAQGFDKNNSIAVTQGSSPKGVDDPGSRLKGGKTPASVVTRRTRVIVSVNRHSFVEADSDFSTKRSDEAFSASSQRGNKPFVSLSCMDLSRLSNVQPVISYPRKTEYSYNVPMDDRDIKRSDQLVQSCENQLPGTFQDLSKNEFLTESEELNEEPSTEPACEPPSLIILQLSEADEAGALCAKELIVSLKKNAESYSASSASIVDWSSQQSAKCLEVNQDEPIVVPQTSRDLYIDESFKASSIVSTGVSNESPENKPKHIEVGSELVKQDGIGVSGFSGVDSDARSTQLGLNRSSSVLVSIAEESVSGLGNHQSSQMEKQEFLDIQDLTIVDDVFSLDVSSSHSVNNDINTGGRHRSRRASKDFSRTDGGTASRECSYSRGSSTEPPSPSVIESSRRAVHRSSSSSVLPSYSKAGSPVKDSSSSSYRSIENGRSSRAPHSFSQSDLTTGDATRSPTPVRYNRNFLLQLQFAPESLQKPSGLPVLPEIILNLPSVRQHQPPPGLSAVATLPRGHSNVSGPNLMPRKSLSDFTPIFARSLSGGPNVNGAGGSSRSQGRRGSGAPQPPSPMTRKVIQVALQQPVTLHTTENAWKPSTMKQEKEKIVRPEQQKSEEMYKKLRAILNKLTPQKFERLNQQVLDLQIDTEERLKGCIDIIFEKAIDEPQFSVGYANLAKNMINLRVPTDHNSSEIVTFRKLLLNQCQREFEKDKLDETDIEQLQIAIDNCTSEEQKKQLIEEREQAETKSRRKYLGNIRFIGELFKLKMLTENIMRDCVERLLKARDEDSLECLCRLLSTIGKDLDDKSRDSVNVYFQRINDIIRKSRVSNRIRFMLQDIMELRNSGWIPRREDNKPQTIDEIHQQAVAEQQQKTTTLLRAQSATLDQRGRHRSSPADTSWKPVGNNTVIDPLRIRLSRQPTDDNIQLGPGSGRTSQSQWQCSEGSVASRTVSSDREQQMRLQTDTKVDIGHNHTTLNHTSSRVGRELAMETMKRDRSAALAAVRNIVGASRSISGDIQALSAPHQDATVSVDHQTSAVSVSVERRPDLEKKTISILKEFLEIKDFQEAVACVRELNCPSFMAELVSQTINHVLEWSGEDRCLCGQLLRRLLDCKLITADHYINGLKDVLGTVEDMEIDIPKVWQYLAEIISPMVVNDHALPLRFLQKVFEPLKQNQQIGDVIAHILLDSAKRLGESEVAKMWQESGLEWSVFVSESGLDSFLKRKGLAWTKTPAGLPVLISGSGGGEWINEQLNSLIVTNNVDNEAIFSWLESHSDAVDTRSGQFIRALMTCVCCSALRDENGTKYRVDENVIKSRAVLLNKYLDHSPKLELQALFALQLLVHRLQHPPNVLLTMFEVLYDEEIISEDAFYQWYDKDDAAAEHPGKGIAYTSVTQFYKWLREASSAQDEA